MQNSKQGQHHQQQIFHEEEQDYGTEETKNESHGNPYDASHYEGEHGATNGSRHHHFEGATDDA